MSQSRLDSKIDGITIALGALIVMLDRRGSIDAARYSNLLKSIYNQPDAEFEREDYRYLHYLASRIDQCLAQSKPG